jgi:hypothetical protein
MMLAPSTLPWMARVDANEMSGGATVSLSASGANTKPDTTDLTADVAVGGEADVSKKDLSDGGRNPASYFAIHIDKFLRWEYHSQIPNGLPDTSQQ